MILLIKTERKLAVKIDNYIEIHISRANLIKNEEYIHCSYFSQVIPNFDTFLLKQSLKVYTHAKNI